MRQENGVWDILSWNNHQKLKIDPNVFSLELKEDTAPAGAILLGSKTFYQLALYPASTNVEISIQDTLRIINGNAVPGILTFGFSRKASRHCSPRSGAINIMDNTLLSPWPFDEYYQVFKCIARRIRKFIKRRGSKSCIREIQEHARWNEKFKFDPVVFAYLKWRAEIEGNIEYWHVDRGKWAHRNGKVPITLPPRESIHKFIGVLLEISTETTKMTDLNWILKHILVKEIKKSFEQWLEFGKRLSQRTLDEQRNGLSRGRQHLDNENISCKDIRAIFCTSNLDIKTCIYFF